MKSQSYLFLTERCSGTSSGIPKTVISFSGSRSKLLKLSEACFTWLLITFLFAIGDDEDELLLVGCLCSFHLKNFEFSTATELISFWKRRISSDTETDVVSDGTSPEICIFRWAKVQITIINKQRHKIGCLHGKLVRKVDKLCTRKYEHSQWSTGK